MPTIGIDARLYSPTFTGIGRYVFELVQQLAELDTKHEFVIFLNDPEYTAFTVPNERWKKVKADLPHYSLQEQLFFSRLIKQEQVDTMYFPHFNVPVWYRDPFVVTIHDLTLHYYPYKEYQPKWSLKKQLQIWAYRFIMRQTVKHAQHIVAVSKNTRDDIVKEYPFADPKSSTILEGVPDTFQPVSAAALATCLHAYGISKPYLLYTGVWRSHKNLLNLMRAFHLLKSSGHTLQLVMTGKKDPAYPEIPQMIQKLGLQDDVICTGFVSEEDLIALNSGAEVFVFPSLYEGFGLPPLEAMQFGVPVVSSDRASLTEVCADAAEYCNPEDVESITNAIERVLKDKERREALVAKGKENLKRFSWKDMSGQILDLLKSVCNNNRQTKKSPTPLRDRD